MTKLTREEELDLLEGCLKRGELEPVVRQYYRLVDLIVGKVLAQKGLSGYWEDFGEDLRNDTFLRLFKNDCARLRRFDPQYGKSLAQWIIMITAQTVLDFIREKDPHSISRRDKVESTDELRQVLSVDEEKRLESRDELKRVEKAVDKLPSGQKMFVRFCILKDPPMSLEEFAVSTDRNIQAVYSLKFRSIEKLRQLLGIDGGEKNPR